MGGPKEHAPEVSPDQVRELWELGWPQAKIARELSTSAYRVAQAAKVAGVVFDGRQTERATAARLARLSAERAELADKFRAAALEGLELAMDRTLRPVDRKWATTMAAIAADKDMALFDHNRTASREALVDLVDQRVQKLTGDPLGLYTDPEDDEPP